MLEQKDANGAKTLLPKTFSMIDRSAKWGVIKKNTAARYKSRITARLKKLAAA
jgi:small subunit ribosomal protein S20